MRQLAADAHRQPAEIAAAVWLWSEAMAQLQRLVLNPETFWNHPVKVEVPWFFAWLCKLCVYSSKPAWLYNTYVIVHIYIYTHLFLHLLLYSVCVTANTYLYTSCDHLIDTLRELLFLVIMTHLKLGFAHLWTSHWMGMSFQMGYTPNYSHLVGIMISKTIGPTLGFLGFSLFSDKPGDCIVWAFQASGFSGSMQGVVRQQWFQRLSSDSSSGAWEDGRSHFTCAALGFQWVLRWSSAFGVVFSVDLWMLRYPDAKRPQSAVNWCWCPESRVQPFDGQKVTIFWRPKNMQGIWGQNSAVFVEGDCNREPGFHRGDVFCDGKYACHLKRRRSWWEIVATLVRCQMNHRDIWPIDGCFQRLMTPQNLSKSISWSDGGRSSVPGVSVIFGHTQIRPDACRGYLGNFAESKTLDYTFPMPRVLWNKKLWLVLQEETGTGTVGRVEFRLWKDWRHDLWSQWLA